MHAFSHLITRSLIKIKDWHNSGLNYLDSALNNTKNDIISLELSDALNADSQPLLEELSAEYTTLQI